MGGTELFRCKLAFGGDGFKLDDRLEVELEKMMETIGDNEDDWPIGRELGRAALHDVERPARRGGANTNQSRAAIIVVIDIVAEQSPI